MNTNELRRGNLLGVKRFGKGERSFTIAVSIDEDGIYGEPPGKEIDWVRVWGGLARAYELEPIPITAAWFEFLGFEKYIEDLAFIYRFTPSYKTSKEDRESIVILNVAGLPEPHNEPIWIMQDKRCRITCVHQLQNIVFSLTGDELTIKKPA